MLRNKKLSSILLLTVVLLSFSAVQPLMAVAGGYPAGSGRVHLQQGMRGPLVAELQRDLARLGYDVGPSDGIFGPKTKSGVLAFQADHGLVVDGIAGPQTLGAINTQNPNTATKATVAAVPTSLSVDEAKMVEMVNRERALVGLIPLAVDKQLVLVARAKAQDMIDKGYFAHQSPTYGSPFEQMRAAGISYRYAGENLAGAPTLDQAHSGLMNSEGHRKNILNPNFTHIGIGVVTGGPYGKMFVQSFIGK
ncbi:MAG: peptidoglycan-binding protein [bacterium]|jgi:uncharacterized YkwD family protein